MEQIMAEFKALSLIYHPDKNPGNKDAGKYISEIIYFLCTT